MPRRHKAHHFADVGLIVLFLVLIGLPVTRNLAVSASASDGTEKRSLAQMPEFRLEKTSLRHFAVRFEAFYKDHFGFREILIRWLHIAEVHWLRVTASPKVILGKHGWLFYNDVPFDCDRANRPFTPEQLAAWQHLLEARRDWLAERGIRFLLVIAPDKQTIYPEYLPRKLSARQTAETRLTQLLAYLREHTDVPVVDLRPPLRQAKTRERIYNRTDSHWNERGAYVAYQTVVEALSPWFAGMRPLPREAFQEQTLAGPSGDCGFLLSLQDQFHEDELHLRPRVALHARLIVPSVPYPLSPIEPLVVLEQDNPRLPRAVVLRDSFGAALAPFLAENFCRTVYVWQDYPTFDREVVEKEHPDVVIQEMVERKLAYPDLVEAELLLPGPRQQTELYLSKTPRAWLSCLRAEE